MSQVKKDVEFESSVNSEGIETNTLAIFGVSLFESSVNSEGIETRSRLPFARGCLRAV